MGLGIGRRGDLTRVNRKVTPTTRIKSWGNTTIE